MSLKEDINSIKKEISAEESFLESFFKIEKFYKKNKIAIIGGISAIVIGIVGFYTYSYFQLQEKIKVNQLFNKALQNPSDKAVLNKLQTQNKKLYEIAKFLNDNSAQNEDEFLNQLSIYTQAITKNDTAKLGIVAQNQNFLLKDFAILNKAIIEAKNGQYAKAKESIKLIPSDSNAKAFVQILQHYLMTK